jgi:hypothetical protein
MRERLVQHIQLVASIVLLHPDDLLNRVRCLNLESMQLEDCADDVSRRCGSKGVKRGVSRGVCVRIFRPTHSLTSSLTHSLNLESMQLEDCADDVSHCGLFLFTTHPARLNSTVTQALTHSLPHALMHSLPQLLDKFQPTSSDTQL